MTIEDNEIYFEPCLVRGRRAHSNTAAYIILALGVATILFHYFVLPHIWAHYGI